MRIFISADIEGVAGVVNAVRFMTKHFVAFLLEEGRAVEWSGQYLIIPLDQPVSVEAGDEIRVTFSYAPGGTIESLGASITSEHYQHTLPIRRAA